MITALPLSIVPGFVTDALDHEVYPTSSVILQESFIRFIPSVCFDGEGQLVRFQGGDNGESDKILAVWKPENGDSLGGDVPDGTPGNGSENDGRGLRSRICQCIIDRGSHLFKKLLDRIDPVCNRITTFLEDLPQEKRMAILSDSLSSHLFHSLQVENATYRLHVRRVYVYN